MRTKTIEVLNNFKICDPCLTIMPCCKEDVKTGVLTDPNQLLDTPTQLKQCLHQAHPKTEGGKL